MITKYMRNRWAMALRNMAAVVFGIAAPIWPQPAPEPLVIR
jgi:hypothetical protein